MINYLLLPRTGSLFVLAFTFFSAYLVSAQKPTGAWKLKTPSEAGKIKVIIFSENYFMTGEYDNKQFIGATGGTYSFDKDGLTKTIEYSTYDSLQVGQSKKYTVNINNNQLIASSNEAGKKSEAVWEKINEPANSPLAGAWRITEREGDDGKMNPMQRGPRKTIKILSNGRFQWAAFNTATKQFMGTGGGTYTVKDGKYTETIEFFSRDNSRVGLSLSFDYEVNNGRWHHQGKSSTGNKVNEIWNKE